MELDKRIKDRTGIQTCISFDKKYIGKKGFFLDEFCQLIDLKAKCCYGTLIDINETDVANDLCFKATSDKTGYNCFFRFFIPEDALNPVEPEKKYREYKDLDEFFDVTGLEIGDLIKLKFPGNNVAELLIVGGCDNGLFIGIHKYTFKQLFGMVEISISGEWQPFGVEE